MGNADGKAITCYGHTRSEVNKRRQDFGQFSLTNLANNWSLRSFLSGSSQQSTYSVSRPWSRISRRGWKESTLNNPLQVAKTTWPVPYVEALFLPEFKIKGPVSESDFQIMYPISHGAFGQVYHVRKISTGDDYAMKILSKAKIFAESAVQQVKDEARIQSTCGHNTFIVNCPFYWQSKKQLYIVSDYVGGGELLDLCRLYGTLPEPLVQLFVAELALALDFLHNAGVIYRDLKLENILLDCDGHCQIIDFGLAKWLRYGDRTSTICGTLLYMAPEVLSRGTYGHAVDWWSLGVLACCMLCGEFPEAAVILQGGGARDVHAIRNVTAGLVEGNAEAEGASGSDAESLSKGAEGCGSVVEGGGEVAGGVGCEDVVDVRAGERTDEAGSEGVTRDSTEDFVQTSARCLVDGGPSPTAGRPPEALQTCSTAARDLVGRLLERDPRKRLRSLHVLQSIAFYHNFSFADVRAKRFRPKDLFPKRHKIVTCDTTHEDSYIVFQDFDSVMPSYV